MVDIEAIVRRYVDDAISAQIKDHRDHDRIAIQALQQRDQDNRHGVLREWLTWYRVFQGLKNEERGRVTKAVLTLVDRLDCKTVCRNQSTIMATCDRLNEACGKEVRRRADGGKRDMTSLASKALWCRFPDKVPIYDSFAQRALWVLSRLCETVPPSQGSEYERFARMWFALYPKALPIIEGANMYGYRYEVRIFDKILWLIGKPDYGIQSF